MRSEGCSRGSSRMRLSFAKAMARHHQAELFDADVFAPQSLRDAAAIDDGNAVGKAQNLIEVVGDQQYGRAAPPGFDEMLMHIGDRTDIEASRWLAGEDEA